MLNVIVNEGQQTVVPTVYLVPKSPPPTTSSTPTTSPTPTPTPTPTLTTIPTTTPTTSPTTTVPTTTPTTSPTTTVPTTSPTTSPTPTTIPTTTPTTSPTTTVPTTSPTTTVPTTNVTTTATTTVPTTNVTTTATTTSSTTATTTIPTTTVTATGTTTTGTVTGTVTPTTAPTTRVSTSQTTYRTPFPTPTSTQTPLVTVTITTAETTSPPVNITGMVFPPIFGGISGVPFILVMSVLCIVLVMVDLFIQPIADKRLPGIQRGVLFLAYALVVAGFFIVLWYFNNTLLLNHTGSPFFFIIIPVSGYLIISGLALFAGTLLAHPLRWTLGGHILFSLVCAFISALALIGSPPAVRIPLALTFGCALIGGLAARWEFLFWGLSWNPVEGGRPYRTGGSNGPGTAPPGATIVSARTMSVPESFPPELLEKYSQPELIGMGGIARVYKAVNNATGEVVALKIPVQFNEMTGKSFMKEIKAWEDLTHENIVSIHEVNILPVPYVEMEYIPRSLADVKKPLQPDEAARIVRGIASGLSYAHSRGIIHRDIKPHNILVTPEGTPKITDWGMSKVMGDCYLPTITGFSLTYAAPEQISPDKFGETDQRTDIYQLGVVFYELLTGELPFGGEDFAQVSARIIADDPQDPSTKNPLAFPLDHIVRKCLEKARENRFHRVDDMIAALDLHHSMRVESGHYEVFEDY